MAFGRPAARAADRPGRRGRAAPGQGGAARPPGRRCAGPHPDVAAAIDAEVGALNADPDALDDLLGRQNYRLAYWRTGRRGAVLPAVLRHRDAGRAAGGGRRGLRRHAPARSCELVARRHGRRAADRPRRRARRPGGLPGPAARRHRRRATSWWRRSWSPARSCPAPGRSPGTSGYDFLNRVNQLFVDPAARGGPARRATPGSPGGTRTTPRSCTRPSSRSCARTWPPRWSG